MHQASSLATAILSVAVAIALPTSAGAEQTTFPELEVPFACGSHVVVSQSHGTFSHVGTDRWAWDFRVPEGTPVVAADDGVVRMVRSDSVRGGCDRSFGPDANYVILSHANGLETQYLHFSRVFVRVGQTVKAGTVLGEVGRTGFSCGAHLHFQLQQTRENAWANQSVPARFRRIGDPDPEQEVVSANCSAPSLEVQMQALAAAAEAGAGSASASPAAQPASIRDSAAGPAQPQPAAERGEGGAKLVPATVMTPAMRTGG